MSTNLTKQRGGPKQADLRAEIARLREQLRNAEETLSAITGGHIDAVVVKDPVEEHQVVMLSNTGIEALDTVRAIRCGEVDAVVVDEERTDDPQVLLLGTAGRRFRLLVENMHEGAVTLSAAGDVAYANAALVDQLGARPGTLLGARFLDFVEPRDHSLLAAMLDGRLGAASRAEITLRPHGGAPFQALVTPVAAPDEPGVSLIVADLPSRRRLQEAEETLRAIAGGQVDAFVVARPGGDEVQLLSEAHRPYRLMVERMQQGAVTLSAGGEILYTNQPFAAMLGQPLETLIGARLADFVAAADHALLAALIEAPEGAAAKIELGLLRAEGGIVPALAAVAMLPVDGGVCLIVTDLTPQRAYESVVAAQAFERSILDQALDAILQLDAGGRVIRASRAAFELCGRNPLLLPFIDAFPLDCPEGAPDLAPVLGGTAALRSREYSLRCANGVDATVLLSAGPLVDADGKACGCVVTMSDITERRLAEDRLRESDRHKDEFLAILAHELRNPLAPIRSAVEILRNTDAATNPDATYAIDIVGRQTANLVRLVDDLLDIHRIGQGKVELQLANIDMRSVVEQAIEITKPQVALKEHDFVAHLPSKPLPVHGDAVRLSQVIVNLVSNAAKYTPPHGKIELTLERSADSSEAVLSVTDNGMGIAPEMLARIFEPYQQAASRGRASAGLGLGLTVCRRLMELHGGSVEALSAGLGHGARFIVRLRLAEAVPAQAATTVPALGFCPALRVLVVDDNRDACDTLAHLLALSGHEVEAVADGAAALDYASRAQLDVVLLDIGLPGMDGYEVARRLRALPNGAQLRVIAMTGYGSAEARRQSRASGIDHHLVKPVDFGALQALLATTN